MRYAFVVDSDRCSGCKACQVACKDKHDLPAGLHWRRVYEVTAGGWEKKDGGWASTVVAYNLSVACHHCEDPVCGANCQPEAIWRRDDGLVLIDDTRCTRCRKCEADCPYGAIGYDQATNTVSKCHFCFDEMDSGLPPACVAACPNRALDFGDLAEMQKRHGTTNRVFPLPDASISRPALVIVPHRNAAAASGREPEVANWEEI